MNMLPWSNLESDKLSLYPTFFHVMGTVVKCTSRWNASLLWHGNGLVLPQARCFFVPKSWTHWDWGKEREAATPEQLQISFFWPFYIFPCHSDLDLAGGGGEMYQWASREVKRIIIISGSNRFTPRKASIFQKFPYLEYLTLDIIDFQVSAAPGTQKFYLSHSEVKTVSPVKLQRRLGLWPVSFCKLWKWALIPGRRKAKMFWWEQ